jgi:CubicO group peptidase (beta-lactamase class C family)/extradiol dioxygenase family protein
MSLSGYKVAAGFAVSDLDRARVFYEGKLGLSVGTDSGGNVAYECGEGTVIHVYLSPEHAGKSTATLAGWYVDDIENIVAELAETGVDFERYDEGPIVTDEKGIATFEGGAKVAYFKDPDGNTLSIAQRPSEHNERVVPDNGMSASRLNSMRNVMAGYVGHGEVPGIVTLVSRWGEVHVEAIGTKAVGGSDPMRRDTIFRITSMTKPVTAAAAMILVEECGLRLDEPVDPLLPELADRKVLRAGLDSALDDTLEAYRSITLRDLLTLRPGIGAVMAPPGRYPIQQAMDEAGVAPGPDLPSLAPDEWMKRLGDLPLVHQPGEKWMYDTGSDVLGVLISRATGQELETFFRERILEPLGMSDTGFHVPADKLGRLASCYSTNPETGELELYDDADASAWSRPPVFESGAGGLVSTVDDYLAFCRMMLDKGKHGGERILSRPSVELMTMDHLTSEQKQGAEIFFGENGGWGFGVGVDTRRVDLSSTPGRFGWAGGYGTSGYSDPEEDFIGILMTQRLADSPESARIFNDFWTLAYQAVDD